MSSIVLRTWHIIFLILVTHYDVEISRDCISQKKELTLVVVELLSHVWLFATPWTVAHQAPLSMGLSRQDTIVGSHALLQGFFLTQGWNLGRLHGRRSLPSECLS